MTRKDMYKNVYIYLVYSPSVFTAVAAAAAATVPRSLTGFLSDAPGECEDMDDALLRAVAAAVALPRFLPFPPKNYRNRQKNVKGYEENKTL